MREGRGARSKGREDPGLLEEGGGDGASGGKGAIGGLRDWSTI